MQINITVFYAAVISLPYNKCFKKNLSVCVWAKILNKCLARPLAAYSTIINSTLSFVFNIILKRIL